MENIIKSLDNIEKALKATLKKHKDLEVEYQILKEERDALYKQIEILKIKSKNLNAENIEVVESVSDESGKKSKGTDKIIEEKAEKSKEIKQIRMELDSYIADLDQCIEIIQSK